MPMPAAFATFACRLLILALPATACLAGQATLTRSDTLREQPSGFSGRIMDVQRRSSVEVLEVRQEWLRVMAPGNRSGWILRQNTDLDAQLPPPDATPAPRTQPAGNGDLQLRGSPRASNHALVIGGDTRNDVSRLAGLMGVPDGNTRYLPGAEMSLDALRQAFVDLDARLGDGDKLLIHVTPGRSLRIAGRACPEGIQTTDRQTFGNDELLRHISTLARRADKLFLIIDTPSTGPGNCPTTGLGSSPLPANVLAFLDNGGTLTPSLLACLEGDAPSPAFADGEALHRCMQARPGTTGQTTARLAGNPALIPVLRPPQAPASGTDSATRLLDTLHAQRDQRSVPEIRQLPSTDGSLRFRADTKTPAYLYVLAAGPDGIALLHPNRHITEARLDPGRPIELTLPPKPAGGVVPRLLFMLSDGPRSIQRAGFIASGDGASSGPDSTSLHRVMEEFLGGDNSPTCRLGETRNLGPTQARQCATRFSAKWITPASGKASR